jgi:hypothetical protein
VEDLRSGLETGVDDLLLQRSGLVAEMLDLLWMTCCRYGLQLLDDLLQRLIL